MPVPNLPPTEAAVETVATPMTCDNVDRRIQPWKAYWPPKKVATAGAPYGFEKGQTIVIYGN